MRFRRIRVRAFGALTDLDTGADPLPSLVVVQAPNEGGKSTFFVLLSSLLYGFYPASRERHPYAPWSGADADADADVLLSGDREVTVHRRLLAAPWGRVSRGADEEELANRTVPWATHVRRQLFDEVFALTLGDLARVDEERWPEIQDRLLGAMGAEDVRGGREVTAELEEEASGLWRTDRRGRPRASALQKELGDLNKELHEARRRDREARETARELEERRSRLEDVRSDRLAARTVLERIRTLLPVRRRLERIREARERAGDPAELEGLPEEPGARLGELRTRVSELAERMEEQQEEVGSLRERVEARDEGDEELLERASEIRRLGKLAGDATELEGRRAAVEVRIDEWERRARKLGGELFDRPWEEVPSDAIRTAPVGELRTLVSRYRDAEEAVTRVRERIEDRGRDEPPGPPEEGGGAGPALVLAGAAAALGTWWAELGPAAMGAAIVLAFAGGLRWARHREAVRSARRARERQRDALAELEKERARAEAEAGAARDEVARAAEALPLARIHLDDPRPEVVHVVERLQAVLEDLRAARREAASLGQRVDDLRRRADDAVRAVELEAPADLPGRVVVLEQALDAAEERRADARSAREALKQIEGALESLRCRAGEAREERDALEARLAALGGGDADQGAEAARQRIAAREKARVLRDELESEHPDLDELKHRIQEAEGRGEEWALDEAARIGAEERVEALEAEEKELIQEIKELENALRDLEEGPTLDRVEGERQAVREELERVRRRRDRLALLSRVVRAADRRFRERNQPDLLMAAGRHLAAITDGRYRRLLMPEGDLDGTLLIQGPGYPGPVPVDTPVSTGTREQVYLALRLAIVDHLDAGGERLPLFLDEAFVNWDAERRERGFSVLGELSGERQIFVFTCHDPMARSLEERGARRIRLDGPA